MIRSQRLGRNGTFAAYVLLSAAFEYLALPRLLTLDVSNSGSISVASFAIAIGIVGGALRVPVAWLLAALVLALYLGTVGTWAAWPHPPENVWLLGLWWTPFLAPPAIVGVIAWGVVTMIAKRRQ